MSNEQTAAIMGAHTLGNLEVSNSGYSGNWLIDPEGELTMRNTFDNSFYSFMMNSDYTYTGRVSFSYTRFKFTIFEKYTMQD